jgi:hypothetical protein
MLDRFLILRLRYIVLRMRTRLFLNDKALLVALTVTEREEIHAAFHIALITSNSSKNQSRILMVIILGIRILLFLSVIKTLVVALTVTQREEIHAALHFALPSNSSSKNQMKLDWGALWLELRLF